MTDNLPAHLKDLQGLAEQAKENFQPETHSADGFLQFNGKTGHFSIDDEEVDGEFAIIHTPSLQHGWMNWADKPPEKAFTGFSQPKPDKMPPMEGDDPDKQGKKKMYESQSARLMMGSFIEEDLGQFKFETSSMGGVENTDNLYVAIIKQLGADPEYCFPKVQLGEEHYKGKRGTIYKPVWDIVAWCNEDGDEKGEEVKKVTKAKAKVDPEPEPEEEAEPAAEEKPARRSRRKR